MEYPFGHKHHRHSQPDSGSNQDPYSSDAYPNSNPNPFPDPNPYPPPSHNPYDYQAPPPVQHVSHEYGYEPRPPPVQHVSHEYNRPDFPNEYGRPEFGNEYGRPTPPVQHVGHEVGGGYGGGGYGSGGYGNETRPAGGGGYGSGGYGNETRPAGGGGYGSESYGNETRPAGGGGYGSGGYGNEMRPAGGGFGSSATHVDHVGHENQVAPGPGPAGMPRQRTVRVFTLADERYSLSVRDGKVVLAPSNPADEYQHWIKDMKYSTRVKDVESQPSFALVNKATGEAIKHSVGANHPVRLVPYNPDYLDESVLWAESKDTGEGYRCIRMINNINLNFDAFNGDEKHGGVRDGTVVVLWEWVQGKNQRWKIVPYSD